MSDKMPKRIYAGNNGRWSKRPLEGYPEYILAVTCETCKKSSVTDWNARWCMPNSRHVSNDFYCPYHSALESE